MARRRTKKAAASKTRKRPAAASKRKTSRKNPWKSKRTGRTLKIENCSAKQARRMLGENAALKAKHKRTVKREGNCSIQSASVKVQGKRARRGSAGAPRSARASGGSGGSGVGAMVNKALGLLTWHEEVL